MLLLKISPICFFSERLFMRKCSATRKRNKTYVSDGQKKSPSKYSALVLTSTGGLKVLAHFWVCLFLLSVVGLCFCFVLFVWFEGRPGVFK